MRIERPPWHTWANRVTQTMPGGLTAESGQFRETLQLVEATVGRPITWSFFFLARVLACEAVAQSIVTVDFNVSTGLGQAKGTVAAFHESTLRPGFCRMVFEGTPLLPNGPNSLKWTSAVRSPVLDEADATSFVTLDRLVAERVECNANVSYEAGEFPDPLTIELFAAFAPYNMRDEWFQTIEEFG